MHNRKNYPIYFDKMSKMKQFMNNESLIFISGIAVFEALFA